MQKHKKPVAYAFIDSQNLNLGVQRNGWKLDWRKFRKLLDDKYGVTHAFLFVGYMEEYEPLYEQMHELGYLVALKPTVDMKRSDDQKQVSSNKESGEDKDKDKEEKRTTKGNVDADLVLYAMKELPNYDKAIIVSGDGDFYSLIEYLLAQNKLLNIMTPNWKYSSLLKPFDDYIVRLDQMRRQLAYYDRRGRSAQTPKHEKNS